MAVHGKVIEGHPLRPNRQSSPCALYMYILTIYVYFHNLNPQGNRVILSCDGVHRCSTYPESFLHATVCTCWILHFQHIFEPVQGVRVDLVYSAGEA